MNIALFDMERTITSMFKEWMTHYSVQNNLELDIISFFSEQAEEKLVKYASGFHIAFISLHQDSALKIGKRIYQINPDCRICYYNAEPSELYVLLSSRPIEFYCLQEGREGFVFKLDRMLTEIQNSQGLFRFASRRDLFQCWQRSILYVHSDLKHICIKCVDGSEKRFYARLTDVEKQLAHGFIRIHKSYIINRMHLSKLDKSRRTVLLTNGEELPVSDAHYQETVNILNR